jgi:hypothetical protein
MRKVLTVLALSGLLASCGNAQTKSSSELNSKESKKMNNKEIVGTFLGAVAKQDAETMRKFANADYIQHNPFVPSGLRTVYWFITNFKRKRNVCRKRANVSRWQLCIYAQHLA